MERLREDILDLGQADSHVLIDGETGTGKTLVAHALHAVGPRASKKFVTISCAAWSEDQLAAKLFGPGGWLRCRWSKRRAAARCALRISRR
jgi:DNA-binding NtrC family response regulator